MVIGQLCLNFAYLQTTMHILGHKIQHSPWEMIQNSNSLTHCVRTIINRLGFNNIEILNEFYTVIVLSIGQLVYTKCILQNTTTISRSVLNPNNVYVVYVNNVGGQ